MDARAAAEGTRVGRRVWARSGARGQGDRLARLRANNWYELNNTYEHETDGIRGPRSNDCEINIDSSCRMEEGSKGWLSSKAEMRKR